MNAQISELVLRIPGLRRQDADPLVQDVMRRVRDGLPPELQVVDLGRVDLRLHLPLGLGRDALAEHIARAILGQLTRRSS